MLFVFVSFFADVGVHTYLERRRSGDGWEKAFWDWQFRVAQSGLSRTDWLVLTLISVPCAAWLLWFTFASKSKRVTPDDKLFVRLMFLGAMIGIVSLLIHIFVKI
jgi:hypothetical protein